MVITLAKKASIGLVESVVYDMIILVFLHQETKSKGTSVLLFLEMTVVQRTERHAFEQAKKVDDSRQVSHEN